MGVLCSAESMAQNKVLRKVEPVKQQKVYKPQPYIIAPDPYAEAFYKTLVHKAIEDRAPDFDFPSLHIYYTLTQAYDPVAETTIKRLQTFAFDVENGTDPEKRKKSLDQYGELVATHLGNIDVVSQALVLARENPKFGDPKFYEWIRAGLLLDIMGSGNGNSLMEAYDALTLGDEVFLLSSLNVKVLRTESAQESSIYYNMHEVEDLKHPEPYWIFVDVSKPMAWLERQKQLHGRKISMPRQ